MRILDWKRYANDLQERSLTEAKPAYEVTLFLRRFREESTEARQFLGDFIRFSSDKGILITGRPGSGKSYLLSKLANMLADDLLHEIDAHNPSDQEYAPSSQTIVPILVRLNKLMPEEFALADRLKNLTALLGYDGDIFGLLRIDCRFVILIDDLDETLTSAATHGLIDVERFVEHLITLPNVKVVIAGREIATRHLQHRFRTHHVCNLARSEIENLLDIITSESSQIIAYLEKLEGLLSFLATPYFAIQTAEFWREPGDRDFSLGRLLFNLIDGLIERQVKTEGSDQVSHILWERTVTLERLAEESLNTGGRLAHSMLASIGSDSLRWFQLMEFISRSPSEPRWSNKWIQAYFVAHYWARDDLFAGQEQRVSRIRQLDIMSPTLTAAIILLQDLTGEDYSVALPEIFDQLEQNFTERERAWFGWGFEQKIVEYVKTVHGFTIAMSPYRPGFLGDGEVDIYAQKRQIEQRRRTVWVAECKFRFPPYPKPIRKEYLEQLQKYKKAVYEQERQEAEAYGESLSFSAILVINGGGNPDDLTRIAREHDIEIWDFDLSAAKFTSRSKISDQMRRRYY